MVSTPGNGGAGVAARSRNHNNNINHAQKVVESLPSRVLKAVVVVVLGLLNWLLFLFLALKSGNFFKQPSEKQKNQFIIAQDALWNLSRQPIPGFFHQFYKTRTGFQFHYITNQEDPVANKDLIIFVHGFPNTCMTWRHLFQESALPTHNATLVAVDLPGHGGSDSLIKYDVQVLELLTDFICGMRTKYGTIGDSVGNTFIVGHDWGCVITMRLATEAPCLADRFILSNGPLIELVKANVERSLSSSRSIFKQFQASPRQNFGCLAKSYHALKPLLGQVASSGYILTFQLPSFFVKSLFEGGNHAFLKACCSREYSTARDDFKAYEVMAANIGPGLEEYKTSIKGGEQYGSSVAQRVHSVGEVFWHATAYYRDGLGLNPWEKSIETVAALYDLDCDLSSSSSPSRRRSSNAASPIFNSAQFKASLHAPVTILWGADDLALTKPICFDGIGDYLARESEVFLFPNANHWFQTGKESRKVMAQVIGLFANGNSKQSPTYIAKEVQKFDSKVILAAKK